VNREQLATVRTLGGKAQTIRADDLVHDLDRTLLVGSMANGHGIHIYLKGHEIHRLVHDHAMGLSEYTHRPTWFVGELVHGHCFRAEWSDFDFVCQAAAKGAWFFWLGFVDSLYRQSWHRDFQGPIREEF
jgi:hypothetical protein